MRTISRLLVAVVMVGSATLWAAGGDLPGSGTEGDPYLIEDLADFDVFASDPNYWDDYTRLETDIDLDDGRPPYTTAVIAPDTDSTDVFFNGVPFEGIFDGNGHLISNITIDTAGTDNDYLGLFGIVSGSSAEVKNVGIENINIIGGEGSDYLGGLCGFNVYGTITNCHTEGSSVSGNDAIGGLCGRNLRGSISSCYAEGGSVSGNDHIGGLVGNNHGPLSRCSATGSVFGGIDVGGLVGVNLRIITECFAIADVTGESNVGGLVGHLISTYSLGCKDCEGVIHNCYAMGVVQGSDTIGGLVGYNGGPISNSYAAGHVYGTGSWIGGLAGQFLNGMPPEAGSAQNSFYDQERTGCDSSGGKTTSQLHQQSTFTDWDFVHAWDIGENQTYPYLRTVPASDINKDKAVNVIDLSIMGEQWMKEQ